MNFIVIKYIFTQLLTLSLVALITYFRFFRDGSTNYYILSLGLLSIIYWSAFVITKAIYTIRYFLLTSSISLFITFILFTYIHIPIFVNKDKTFMYIVIYLTFLLIDITGNFILKKIDTIHAYQQEFYQNLLVHTYGIILVIGILAKEIDSIVNWLNLTNRELILRPYLPPLSLILFLLFLYTIITHIITLIIPQYAKTIWEYTSLLFVVQIFLLIAFGIYETPTTLPLTFESCKQIRKNTITSGFPRYCITVDGRRIKE